MKRLLCILLLVIAIPLLSFGQNDKEQSSTCLFKVGRTVLSTEFGQNRGNLDEVVRFIQIVSEKGKVEQISIISGASPEGPTLNNIRLSERRGQALVSYLQQTLHLPDSVFEVHSLGQDWQGLIRLVEASDMENKEEVLSILRNTPEHVYNERHVLVDGWKKQLMNLHGGRTWNYMLRHFFPDLRHASVVLVKYRLPEPLSLPIPKVIEYPEPKAVIAPVVVDTSHIFQPLAPKRPFYFSVRTNLLYDAAITPNIGVEWYLGKQWTIGANWAYAWWKTDHKHFYWRIYGGEAYCRKYLGRLAEEKPLQGHHVGLYFQGVTYDFEFTKRGILSDFSYGGGLEYGYSMPIRKRLNLDFSLGVGFHAGKYKEYLPIDECYVWQATKKRKFLGITKAEISLVWLLGRGNVNNRKGGGL